MAELVSQEVNAIIDFDKYDKMFEILENFKQHVKTRKESSRLFDEINYTVLMIDSSFLTYETIKKCWGKLDPHEAKESFERFQAICAQFASYFLKTLSKIRLMLPEVWTSILNDLEQWAEILDKLEANYKQSLILDKTSDQVSEYGIISDSCTAKTNTQEVNIQMPSDAHDHDCSHTSLKSYDISWFKRCVYLSLKIIAVMISSGSIVYVGQSLGLSTKELNLFIEFLSSLIARV